MRTMALGIITGLLLSSCGQEARRITVVTPFLVKNPAQPTHANVAELVNAESTVTATPPTTLPPGVSSAYCFQPDLRMSYSDPRPGYPSFSGRINLITEKTASPWSSPATGPIGLNDAISLLRNPAKSFLPAPITLDLPVTSQGTIRIDGTLVRPSGTTQVVCPNNDASANIESYAVWGEAKIQPGGSSTVTFPLSVVSTTPRNPTSGSIPYVIPTISGNTITNPIGASDIKCRNLTNPATCMNRNLLEFKFHITSASGPNNNEYVFEARGLSEWDTFEARVPVHVDQYGQYQFYLPKRNLYLLQYTLINGGDSVEVWIDFAQKKYRYSINSSPPVNLDLKDCSLGRFALTIPINSGTITTPSAPANCAFGSASSNPNLIVSDLGYGF
jgi:hypothetical protein